MSTIYLATNKVNGKKYVGFDSNWPHRKHAHKHAAKVGAEQPLERAIRKYGFDSFEWRILYESENRDHTLNVMEPHFIMEHNSYGEGGYNITLGGEGAFGWVPSKETRIKISESNLGKKAWNMGVPSPWTTKRNKENKGGKQPNLEKTYKFIEPSGAEHVAKGLKKFCAERGLNAGNMSSVASGRLPHYKKWKCVKLLT